MENEGINFFLERWKRRGMTGLEGGLEERAAQYQIGCGSLVSRCMCGVQGVPRSSPREELWLVFTDALTSHQLFPKAEKGIKGVLMSGFLCSRCRGRV